MEPTLRSVGTRDTAKLKKVSPKRWGYKEWLLPIVALLALAGFGTTIFWVRGAKPLDTDIKTTLALQSIHNPLFYRIMTLASSLGYAPVIQWIVMATAGFLWIAGRRLESLFALASTGAVAAVVLVKVLVGRPRPTGKEIRVAVKLPDYGFPSGHTVHYVSFYGFLAYLAATRLKPPILRRSIVTLSTLLAVLVGPSRIYLGQHWLSDVVAAYLFGLAYLIGLVEAYERIKAIGYR